MSLLLNYVLDVAVTPSAPTPNFAFLDKICVVVKPNASGTDGAFVVINSPDEIINHTDNTSIVQLFNSGASSVSLITKNDLDIENFVNSNIFQPNIDI